MQRTRRSAGAECASAIENRGRSKAVYLLKSLFSRQIGVPTSLAEGRRSIFALASEALPRRWDGTVDALGLAQWAALSLYERESHAIN